MLTLRHAGGQSLIIAPRHGAAIVGWCLGPIQILRHARPEAVAGDVHMMGCFPLVPYCNRIADGRFSWSGRDYQLDLNFGDHPNSIHGIGWLRAWKVEDLGETFVTMSLSHEARGDEVRAWPFPFDASITYRLGDNGLVISLCATNRHDGPAPMGLGLHPYFNANGHPALTFGAAAVWRNQASLPSNQIQVPDAWSHASGRTIGTVALDNCFTGWTGHGQVDAGPASLRIDADPIFGNLQVFTPHGADFYCVEPVSHLPDAINRPDLPSDQRMAVLHPGETIGGNLTFSLP